MPFSGQNAMWCNSKWCLSVFANEFIYSSGRAPGSHNFIFAEKKSLIEKNNKVTKIILKNSTLVSA